MKKFKVVINEDKYFILELSGLTLVCKQNLENISQLNEYFETRATSKKICRGYFSRNDLPEEFVIQAQQKLNYLLWYPLFKLFILIDLFSEIFLFIFLNLKFPKIIQI